MLGEELGTGSRGNSSRQKPESKRQKLEPGKGCDGSLARELKSQLGSKEKREMCGYF